jgi:SAM-dependent methyltransferase
MKTLRPFLRQLYYERFAHRHLLTRRKLAAAYLRGAGLEIGALDQPLPVPRRARVTYVDRLSVPDLRRQYPELAGRRLTRVDVVDDGEALRSFADGSQDFVIANHFIEHCADPVGAIRSHFRVLRPGGCLFLAVPDKRHTFDRCREVTPLAHFWHDHEGRPEWTRERHFEEFARGMAAFGGGAPDEARVRADVQRLLAGDYSIHYHVWTAASWLEFVASLRRVLEFDVEVFLQNGLETDTVLRKAAPAGEAAPAGPQPPSASLAAST